MRLVVVRLPKAIAIRGLKRVNFWVPFDWEANVLWNALKPSVATIEVVVRPRPERMMAVYARWYVCGVKRLHERVARPGHVTEEMPVLRAVVVMRLPELHSVARGDMI